MSDVESLFGGDQGKESFDPAAFERFKEQMAAASAQLKALQVQEQKQKKKEDELVKILLRFIQSGTKRELLMLVARLLEQNVPAAFIVGILLISEPFIQQELNIKLLPAPASDSKTEDTAAASGSQNLPEHYLGGILLPLKLRIAIDRWAKEIYVRALEKPERLLVTVIDPDGLIKLPALQLANFCLRDFLAENNLEIKYEDLKDFINLMMEKILTHIHEELNKTKKLEK